MTWWVAGSVVVGSLIQSNAADNATDAQRGATDASLALQERQFNQQREDFAPWRTAGANALGQLQAGLNQQPTAEEVMATPGYQFGRDQGQQGLDRRIAAMGGRVSGNAIKAASRFNTDYATSGYNAAYQRGQDRLNRLQAIAGLGQTATGASAAAGGQATNAMTGLIAGQGDATAAGRLAQGNIWGNAANQFGALYGRQARPSGYVNPYTSPNNWQQYDTMDPNNTGPY